MCNGGVHCIAEIQSWTTLEPQCLNKVIKIKHIKKITRGVVLHSHDSGRFWQTTESILTWMDLSVPSWGSVQVAPTKDAEWGAFRHQYRVLSVLETGHPRLGLLEGFCWKPLKSGKWTTSSNLPLWQKKLGQMAVIRPQTPLRRVLNASFEWSPPKGTAPHSSILEAPFQHM